MTTRDFTHRGYLYGTDRDSTRGKRKRVWLRSVSRAWICSDGHTYDRYGYSAAPGSEWALELDSIEAVADAETKVAAGTRA